MARKLCPQTPFILVSGTIGEQAAIESLKAGAADYVLKQHPERLPSAVRRAVKEAGERAKRREAELELARREKYFRALTENSLDILCVMNREGNLLYNSASIKNVLGYTPEEMLGENVFTRVHAEDLPRAREALQLALEHPERTVKLQVRYKNQAGEWRRLELVGKNRLADPEINGVVASCRDVTDRWRVEEELRDSEQQYRLLFHSNPNPVWVFDMETQAFLEVNEAAIQHYGYSREEFLAMTILEIRSPEENRPHTTAIPDAAVQGRIWRHRRKDGSLIDVEVIWAPMIFHGRFAALTMAVDVTERLRVEQRNAVFSKLSHRLSSATTVAEAAAIISEATDALFHWSDFALDLYDAGTRRSEHAAEHHDCRGPAGAGSAVATAQDKQRAHPAGHRKGRGTSDGQRIRRICRRHHAGSHPQGRARHRPAPDSKSSIPFPTRKTIWSCSRRWPTSAAAPWSASAPSRICGKPSSASATSLTIRPMPFLWKTWTARCWM